MPWKFLQFGAKHNTIEVAYVAGDDSCTKPEGFYVTAKGATVIVAAVSETDATQQACGGRAVVERVLLSLPTEVGGSVELMHAPVDRSWSTGSYFD